MITRKEIEELNEIRKERRRLEKLDKEMTAALLNKATEDGHEWRGLSYTITEGKSTTADREKIQTLPNWEQYYKTTTYQKINIKA